MCNQKQYGTNVSVNHIAFSNNDCSDDEHDNKVDSINIYDEYSHSEIIDRCDFGRNHLIHARLSSNKSVIQNKVLEKELKTIFQIQYQLMVANRHKKTYPTMLKLIHGALKGGGGKL